MQFQRRRDDVIRWKNEKRPTDDDRAVDRIGQDEELGLGKGRHRAQAGRITKSAQLLEKDPSGGSLDRIVGQYPKDGLGIRLAQARQ